MSGKEVIDGLLAACGPGATLAGGNANPKDACDVLVIDGPVYEAHSVGLRLVKYAALSRRFVAVGVPARFAEVAGRLPGQLRRVGGELREVEVAGVLPAVRGWLKKVTPLWRPVAHHRLPDGLDVLVLERDAPAEAAVDIGTVPSVPPPELAPRPPGGIGTEVTELLAGYGLNSASLPKLPSGCPECENLAQQMDLGGPDWCALNREGILCQLRVAYKNLPRPAKLRAFARGAWSFARGTIFPLNLLDPAPGILDEATRRWMLKFKEWEQSCRKGKKG